jgi:hypothetical protein
MAYNTSILSMINKIRAITEDFAQNSSEVFSYEDSNIFVLSEPRISEILSITLNGSELESGQSSEFNEDSNELTIVDDLESGDIIKVIYKFYNKSDSELYNYIVSALVFLSVFDTSASTYKLSSEGTIIPSPSDKDKELICMIASILIKPDFISYKTSNMQITYPTKMTKEEKIEEIIRKLRFGTGVVLIAQWDSSIYDGEVL